MHKHIAEARGWIHKVSLTVVFLRGEGGKVEFSFCNTYLPVKFSFNELHSKTQMLEGHALFSVSY